MLKRIATITLALAAVFVATGAPAIAADDDRPIFLPAKKNLGTLKVNSVQSTTIVDYSILSRDIDPAVVRFFRTPTKNSVTSWSVKDGSVKLEDLDPALQKLIKDMAAKCGAK